MTEYDETADELDADPGGPWAAMPRPTRVQVLALVLITLLALGPVVALVVALRSDRPAILELATEPATPTGGAHIIVTVTGVQPTSGELQIRAVVQPDPDDLSNGRPTRELSLAVNDVRGRSTVTWGAGQPLGPAEFSLALTDGSVTQFPFDTYLSDLVMILSTPSDTGTATGLPATVTLESSVDSYDVQGSLAPAPDGSAALRSASFDVSRTTSTVVYVVWIMVLMYGLALSGVLFSWVVVIRRRPVPFWAYAVFVGVLFALPPLRLALPGNPPLGVLVDFVSFYWAVTIVGVTLVLLILFGLRQEGRLAAEAGDRSGDDRSSGVGTGDDDAS